MKTPEEKIAFVRATLLPTVFRGYMVEDLKSLLAIDKTPGRVGACNFPIALYVLSCMDYLGFLVATIEYRTKGEDTLERIRSYADACFPEFTKKELAGKWPAVKDIFRNGLTHVFFPKQGGVSRVGSQNVLAVSADGRCVLDADALAHAFIASIDNLKSLLMTDDALCERLFDRYQFLDNKRPAATIPQTSATVSNSAATFTTTSPVLSSKTTLTLPPKM